MAEIVSKPSTTEYRDNWDKVFTKVEIDKIADHVLLRALRGGKEIHSLQVTEKMLLMADRASDVLRPFFSAIPGLTEQEGYELVCEALREQLKRMRTHATRDQLAREVELWELGGIKLDTFYDVDPRTGAVTKKGWEQRARSGEHAVPIMGNPPHPFCLEHGHVRSLGYKGPRFVCLVCHNLLDRDPENEAIFIKLGKPLACACGNSRRFKLTDLTDRKGPVYECLECGTLCVD